MSFGILDLSLSDFSLRRSFSKVKCYYIESISYGPYDMFCMIYSCPGKIEKCVNLSGTTVSYRTYHISMLSRQKQVIVKFGEYFESLGQIYLDTKFIWNTFPTMAQITEQLTRGVPTGNETFQLSLTY